MGHMHGRGGGTGQIWTQKKRSQVRGDSGVVSRYGGASQRGGDGRCGGASRRGRGSRYGGASRSPMLFRTGHKMI